MAVPRDVITVGWPEPYPAAAPFRLQLEHIAAPAGTAGRPTLVFLHEGLGSIDLWRDFPAALCAAAGCPGLMYDRLGYGGSDPLREPRDVAYLHREAALLPQVLAAAGVADHIVIGHSDGGSIALLYAATRPAGLLAAVTEAAHVFVEDVTLQGIRIATDGFETGGLAGRLARYHGDKTEATFRAWSDTWLSPPFAGWNIEAVLPQIAAPLLVIQGVDDEYGTPAQVEAICRQSGGPATPVLLPDCAHIPHHQARNAVLDAAQTFIDGICRRRES